MKNKKESSGESGVYRALQVEYREMASWYDSFWRPYLDQTLRKPLDLLHQQVAAAHPRRLTVADIGCGTGVYLQRFISQQREQANDAGSKIQLPKLIGIEPSKAMLDQARLKFDDNIVDFQTAPAEKLPLPDESVDVVCSTSAFHFFRDKQRALVEMKRVLNKNGTLVITDWCNDYILVKLYHNVIERLRWIGFKEGYPGPIGSKEMLELVTETGFENIRIETYTIRFWWIVIWGMHTITATKT